MKRSTPLRIAAVACVLAAIMAGCGPGKEGGARRGGGAAVTPARKAEFAVAPKLTRRGVYTDVEFELSVPADVTVAVLSKDGRVVRHIGCGALGTNAPGPFRKGELAQKLTWDGRDDRGKPVAEGCRVMVGAGTEVVFDRSIEWERPEGAPAKGGGCLAVDRRREELYVAGTSVPGFLRLYGRTGRIHRMEKISQKLAAAQVTGIALDMEGELYLRILRDGKDVLQRYDRGGISILFGNKREVELAPRPKGTSAAGLAVDQNGNAYVVSRVPGGGRRGAGWRDVLEVYGPYGRPRKSDKGVFAVPVLDPDGFGRAAAVEGRGSVVVVTDVAGNAMAAFGSSVVAPGSPSGGAEGIGCCPYFRASAAGISDEAVYVLDAENGRVVRGKITFAQRAEIPVE